MTRAQAYIRGYEAREAGRPLDEVADLPGALKASWLEGWAARDAEEDSK